MNSLSATAYVLRNKNVDALELRSNGDQAELLRKAQAHWSKVNG